MRKFTEDITLETKISKLNDYYRKNDPSKLIYQLNENTLNKVFKTPFDSYKATLNADIKSYDSYFTIENGKIKSLSTNDISNMYKIDIKL